MYTVYPDPSYEKVKYQVQSYNAAVSLHDSLTKMGYPHPAIAAEAELETRTTSVKDVAEATVGLFGFGVVSGFMFYLMFLL